MPLGSNRGRAYIWKSLFMSLICRGIRRTTEQPSERLALSLRGDWKTHLVDVRELHAAISYKETIDEFEPLWLCMM